jgi:hypothetical protein
VSKKAALGYFRRNHMIDYEFIDYKFKHSVSGTFAPLSNGQLTPADTRSSCEWNAGPTSRKRQVPVRGLPS